jgi:hypothetical protein
MHANVKRLAKYPCMQREDIMQSLAFASGIYCLLTKRKDSNAVDLVTTAYKSHYGVQMGKSYNFFVTFVPV